MQVAACKVGIYIVDVVGPNQFPEGGGKRIQRIDYPGVEMKGSR